MTEFDEIVTVRRIIALYRERGIEKVDADIRKTAKSIANQCGMSHEKALSVIEGRLLEENPNPEKWD